MSRRSPACCAAAWIQQTRPGPPLAAPAALLVVGGLVVGGLVVGGLVVGGENPV